MILQFIICSCSHRSITSFVAAVEAMNMTARCQEDTTEYEKVEEMGYDDFTKGS